MEMYIQFTENFEYDIDDYIGFHSRMLLPKIILTVEDQFRFISELYQFCNWDKVDENKRHDFELGIPQWTNEEKKKYFKDFIGYRNKRLNIRPENKTESRDIIKEIYYQYRRIYLLIRDCVPDSENFRNFGCDQDYTIKTILTLLGLDNNDSFSFFSNEYKTTINELIKESIDEIFKF